MDILSLLQEKSFIGQEFLTWLWWMCEQDEAFTMADGRQLSLAMGQRLSLSPTSSREGNRVALAGSDPGLAEAREALRQGKLVDNLRLAFVIDSEEYWLSLDATWLMPKGVRLPAAAEAEEPGLDADALVLERIALLENLTQALDHLLAAFLSERVKGANAWPGWHNWRAGQD